MRRQYPTSSYKFRCYSQLNGWRAEERRVYVKTKAVGSKSYFCASPVAMVGLVLNMGRGLEWEQG